ncbi:binding-protein-dependent transport systems inner membrane component [Candidatus Vecturithrix granuli]|uniref:Binding-protein-dependent transport systems inner membrane component n=1 Tax=Vecturithrix granuli TaxID=1499967 RepID=A0A081C5K7_VECG1|nr:binding-protein-dependent transport systems inner membrane component [Candidatus Vecturithrix granuli]
MRRSNLKYDKLSDVLLFLLPGFSGFCLFILFPIFASIALSFTNYTGGKTLNLFTYELTAQSFERLPQSAIPEETLQKLAPMEGKKYPDEDKFVRQVQRQIGKEQAAAYGTILVKEAKRFFGFHNYLTAFRSANFWRAVRVTVVFVIFTIGFQIGLGLIFAVILNSQIIGRSFFRSVIFLPVVLSAVAISLAFMLIFHPQKGPLNQFLISLGLSPLPWLTGANTALPTVIFIVIWQTFGYYMVLLLSGLQTINPSLYEAAEIDGASGVQKFLHVTIPMLSPVLFLCIILAVIRAFQVFDQIFVLTGGQDGGGPAGATTTLVFDVYLNAFSHWKMGYASAEATILLAVILIITIIQYTRQRKWVTYDVV